MGNNIYEQFKRVQGVRDSAYNRETASFVENSTASTKITNVAKSKVISASLVFDEKEGSDNVVVFTLIGEDNIQKGGYFIYDSIYYLVYEDVKIVKEDVAYKKQKAIECNVEMLIGGNTVNAAFMGPARKFSGDSLTSGIATTEKQQPIIIVPDLPVFAAESKLTIGGRTWRISDYDNITNKGLMYLYVEPTTEPVVESVIEPETETEPELDLQLQPMISYIFNTMGAYFIASPPVNIIRKTPTEVEFKVPLSVEEVTISVKNEDGVVEQNIYKVVI